MNNDLIGTGNCSTAIIIGHDGSVWAKSPAAQLNVAEGMALVSAFNDPALLYAHGTTIGNTRYMTVRADTRTIIAVKGAKGLVAVKTSQCILIAFYNENMQVGQCARCVEHLADLLIANGYQDSAVIKL